MLSNEKILILEDDTVQAEAILNGLKERYPHWEIIYKTNLEDALKELELSLTPSHSAFSLFLLDIQLSADEKNRDGYVFAGALRSKNKYFQTPVIFLTVIQDDAVYALSNFHCYNYIPKPYTISDLIDQIEQMRITGYLNNSLLIKDYQRITHHINPDEIIMITAQSHVLHIHLKDCIIKTREYSLDSISAILSKSFVRCHKKYIINLLHVTSYDEKDRILHINDLEIPVSTSGMKLLQSRSSR